MGTWGDAKKKADEGGSFLLPVGNRTFRIDSVQSKTVDFRRGPRRICEFLFSSEAGRGSHYIDLEPVDPSSEQSREIMETIFASWASTLGFEPTHGSDVQVADAVNEFVSWAMNNIVGAIVELNVIDKPYEVNGETKEGRKVYINQLVEMPNKEDVAVGAEEEDARGKDDDDIPW